MRQFAVFTGILVLSGAAFAADPGLMNLVMPDVKVLAGANVTSARISPLGQFLLLKISAGGQLQKLTAAAGVDPLQDVTEILAATTADVAAPGGLVLLRGNFKVDQILANFPADRIQTNGDNKIVIVSDAKGKVQVALAFIGTTIAIAGDAPAVTAALGRSTGSNAIDPKLAVQVNALAAANDAWVVSTAGVAGLLPATGNAAQAAQMLKNVQGLSGGVKFGPGIQGQLEVVADTAKNAESLGDVARLVISLASMNAPKDAQTAELLKLVQTLQISTKGTAVDLALTVPEATFEGLVGRK